MVGGHADALLLSCQRRSAQSTRNIATGGEKSRTHVKIGTRPVGGRLADRSRACTTSESSVLMFYSFVYADT
jgi:hypothetical protein